MNITKQERRCNLALTKLTKPRARWLAFKSRIHMAIQRSIKDKLDERLSVLDFGADPTGTVDSTAAFNLATGAADEYNETIFRRSIYIPDGRYKIDGKVYVRKGQTLFGNGGASHLYMGSTGGIVMGWKSDGTEDPSGRPPRVSDIWIEGGWQPIFVEVSGWSVDNVFISFPVAGMFATGTDGHITDCTFDGGSGLLSLSGGAHTVSNCIFFLGTNQLSLGGDKERQILHSSTITNCVFNFPSYSSIRVANGKVKNVTLSNCTFNLNEQFKTHKGYIITEWSGGDFPQPEADMIIDGCSFVNPKEYAIDLNAGSGHNLMVSNCTIDGEQPHPLWATAASSKGIRMGTRGILKVTDTVLRNLKGQPVSLEGTADIDFRITDCDFDNCTGGDVDILVTNTSRNTKVRLRDVKGSGRQLYDLHENTLQNFHSSGLDDWFEIKESGGREYIELPFIGATMYELDSSISPHATNTQYRLNERYIFGVSVDYQSGVKMLTDIQEIYKSRTPSSLSTDYQVEFDAVGGGTSKDYESKGKIVLSYPANYARAGLGRINISPMLTSRGG
ncbi:hypothetical protein vBVpaPMGD2_5 [Vibrio phage vB_VpaP_MGD2]|uniref:Uncharacterized protein n=1 Tax=Vibrio phage vB_VpaP_MGD2 TaxID=2565877 RepID=A0A6B7HXB4_9CAUD|nr:hypothetical protein vBVpaPMGD2_5 [Vibrio phage vB_VpaP_MGD2]